MSSAFDIEALTRPGGIVPVDIETTAGLVREVLRLQKALEAAADTADRYSFEAAQAIRRIGALPNGDRQ